jgi:translation initiation factor eIF-2B subunit epsilon
MKEGVKSENLVLEVNSSRHAYAVTPCQVIQSVLTSILRIGAAQAEDNVSNPAKLLVEVNRSFKQFSSLLGKYVKSPGAQADCLASLALFCMNNDEASTMANFLPIVAKVIHTLYEEDILSDEAIFRWFKDLPSDSKVKDKTKLFVEWLEDDDEEEGESSSSEEEDA